MMISLGWFRGEDEGELADDKTFHLR